MGLRRVTLDPGGAHSILVPTVKAKRRNPVDSGVAATPKDSPVRQ